nr:MAG TPA: hypothetical protein [Caudoviricetes sp.]
MPSGPTNSRKWKLLGILILKVLYFVNQLNIQSRIWVFISIQHSIG